ncbi:MAG: PD40 domain-containing protein [Candidatus Latescibacterota bacterium]|nr:MAG: PD40 domain-containing protein [Candidatus Latescibacterota bacterium]
MMKWHVGVLALLVAAVGISSGCGGSKDTVEQDSAQPVLTGDYLGQTAPGMTPELFAPGFVSTGMYERDVAMTPDGNELYFGLMSGGYVMIIGTKQEKGKWSPPEIASFCDNPDAFDLEPHITPDGKRMLFLSTRPQPGQEPMTGWVYQDIWAADREGDGWSQPYNIGWPINTDDPEYFPSVTKDGTMYFTREIDDGGKRRSLIHRSRSADGKYEEAEVLPEQVNPGDMQFNAFIDPDEKYLIVCMAGHPENIGRGDYYVCFRSEDDTWTDAINMGEAINTPGNNVTSPYVSPDGKYFFFASNRKRDDTQAQTRSYAKIQEMANDPQNGSADIYWIDASYIETLRPE